MITWHVIVDNNDHSRGTLIGPDFSAPCALGRAGVTHGDHKIEGDGKTPLGCYSFRRVYYRADRLKLPNCAVPAMPITQQLGWCDDPQSNLYNQPVTLPFEASAEHLWRQDHAYDLIIVISHNDNPVVANKGSAIFIHVAQDDFKPTQGCIAIKINGLLNFLKQITPQDTIKTSIETAD